MSIESGIPTFPKVEDIQFKVHYPPGTRVWVYAGRPRRGKVLTCPCCGKWHRFFFDALDVIERKVIEVRVHYKGTVPEVAYHLDDNSSRNVVQVFATEGEAKRYARARCKQMNEEALKNFEKEKARLQTRVVKLMEAARMKDATKKIAALFKGAFKEERVRR
jgi:RNase P subunit RPR2